MIKTFTSCCGYTDGKPCPYNATVLNEENKRTCRIHYLKLVVFQKTKIPPKVSWIESGNNFGTCHICASVSIVKRFKCNKHLYCDECIDDAQVFERCPICLSLQEN